MLVTMAKVEIIGPKRYFYEVLSHLHQIGTIHIEDISKEENIFMRSMGSNEEATKSQSQLNELITRLNGIMHSIEPKSINKNHEVEKDFWKKETPELLEEGNKLIGQLEEEARSVSNQKRSMELELAQLDRYQDVMKKVHPLAKKIVPIEDTETVAFVLEGTQKNTISLINAELEKITENKHQLISTPIDKKTTAAIVVFSKKCSGKIHHFLADKVSEIRLPSSLKDLSIDKVLNEIESKKTSLPKEIKELDKKIESMAKQWYYKLFDLTNAMNNKIEEIKQIPTLGETDYTFVVQGWLPQKKLDKTKKTLQRSFGNRVLLTQLKVSDHELENAPVVVENPTWAKPYELLLNIWEPPRYGTVDPTKFLAIFFPLFFGYILGDIGYGLIVLLAATFLKSKFGKDNQMVWAGATIFQVAGFVAIIFGVIYGEFFGTLLEHFVFPVIGGKFYEHHEYLFKVGPMKWPYARNVNIENRTNEFMIITLGLGFIHLAVSLGLGVVNAVKENSQKHIIEKMALLTILFSGLGIALLPALKVPFVLLILLGVFGVGYGVGPFAAMEHVFGLIGNLFSYLRLMAIGFAGAILAAAANELAIEFGKQGAMGLILGILVATVLHTLNVVIHTFSPAIHAIRLNFLEGFGKFYEAGSKTYKPFKARR